MDYVQSFAEFGNVLQGFLLSDWKQVLAEHFPESVDPEVPLLATQKGWICSMVLIYLLVLGGTKLKKSGFCLVQ